MSSVAISTAVDMITVEGTISVEATIHVEEVAPKDLDRDLSVKCVARKATLH
jgi:hypothetical protein